MRKALLIPQDKSDVEAVRRAALAGYPAVAPLLPNLLEWMQDANWPVARELAPFLCTIGAPLAPHILAVLQGEDDVWKYWLLTQLVPNMSHEAQDLLMQECRRIANEPTANEVFERVQEAAQEVLRLRDSQSDNRDK